MPSDTTPTAAEIAELRAALAELEAETAAAAAPSDAEVIAAIAKANKAFLAAGQPLVLADLVRGMAPDTRQQMTPAQMAAMIPADRQADFLTRLDALVRGLKNGRA